jgi:hypothetical protein
MDVNQDGTVDKSEFLSYILIALQKVRRVFKNPGHYFLQYLELAVSYWDFIYDPIPG